MANKNLYQWSEIFRALGSPYRLHIIKLLNNNGKMTVSVLTKELDISFKNTSRNLKILRTLDILKAQGKNNHVYYEINPEIKKDLIQIIKFVLK